MRIRWLKEGDKNTRLFPIKSSYRHKKNQIEGLRNKVGMWISDERGLCNDTRNYFETLFAFDYNGMFEEILKKI